MVAQKERSKADARDGTKVVSLVALKAVEMAALMVARMVAL